MPSRSNERQMGAGLDAIAAVYAERFSDFLRIAMAIAGDRERGRDAVQEAFADAVRSRRTFRGEGPLEAWLWRIVLNRARKERRPGTEAFALQREARWQDDGREVAEHVRSVIPLLPERQRLVLFLRYYADLDYRTIGEILGVRSGTVGATLNAAHTALRRRLEEVQR